MKRPLVWGISATALLWALYVVLMASTMPSFTAARLAFLDIWGFIAILGIGFGIQIGLWQHLRARLHDMHGTGTAAASGTSSGIAMAACCAHHAADILPLVGFAGIAGALTRYQEAILFASIGITLFGIAYMLYLLKAHSAHSVHCIH